MTPFVKVEKLHNGSMTGLHFKEDGKMKYTEYGLMISLDELRRILEYAENRAEYGNMEKRIYISGGDKPQIKQYCQYAECNPINHTYGVI